jgi:hypothetical protein
MLQLRQEETDILYIPTGQMQSLVFDRMKGLMQLLQEVALEQAEQLFIMQLEQVETESLYMPMGQTHTEFDTIKGELQAIQTDGLEQS